MSTSADLMVARVDYERRLELAGIDLHDRHHHAERRLGHGRPGSQPGPATHPLAAFVARLVSGAGRAPRRPAQQGAPVVAGTPRHP